MPWRLSGLLLLVAVLAGCAVSDGHRLRVGASRIDEVERTMGLPALRWREPDGGELLAYPFGPMGYYTYMVRTDRNGTLVSHENVLDPVHFARLKAGMTEEEVLRTLGPSVQSWTVYFKARDELVWEWRYCDDWGEPARFNVLFDGSTRRLRTTMSQTESMRGFFGMGDRRQWCKR
ncbi:MAG: hypothetical protein Q8N89_08700 [Azonexus sp.]|nr:hypothetical protein [Azonexus sp.]